ncbi:MAG: SPOR domain-containing protein [Bacteroidales bacterium]|nr:SPOR domain-containing protein [Bacteroidales bacterium]
MKLEPFIIEKLYQGISVNVENLGTFHPVDKCTSIHPGDHQFQPAERTVNFENNPNIKDDMLAGFIAEKKGISKEEALEGIKQQVEHIKSELKAGKKVQLQNIGFLFYDFQGDIKLDVDKSVNYSKETYGLPSFKADLIKSTDKKTTATTTIKKEKKNATNPKQQDKKVKEKTAQRSPGKTKSGNKKKQHKKDTSWIIPFLILILIGVAGWYFQDVWKPWLGFNKKPEKTAIAEADTTAEVSKKDTITSTDNSDTLKSDNASGQIPIPEQKQGNQKKETETFHKQASEGDYLIIAGCFRSQKNAEELVEELKGKGYQATIQGQTPKGLQRVVYSFHTDKQTAIKTLHQIRAKENSGAWLDRY